MQRLLLALILGCGLTTSSCKGLLLEAEGLDFPTANVTKVVEIVRKTLISADLDKDGHIQGLDEWGAFVTALFANIRDAMEAQPDSAPKP